MRKPTRLNTSQRAFARSGMQRYDARQTVFVVWPETRWVTEAVVIGWARDAWDTEPDEHARPERYEDARHLLDDRGLVTFGRERA